MAELAFSTTDPTAGNDSFGNEPEVSESLKPENRVISSVSQAINLTNTDMNDARQLINAAALITAKKQGARPYIQKNLTQQGKGWKTNISTRALQKELRRCAPRLYMPILTASTLTAAQLPAGWPQGPEKTTFFRDTVTKAIRSWRKNDFYWRGLGREVVDYGFAFACWTDPYEWRPHLVRMDRGFVPRGTEVMDERIARFTLLWDYAPDELLRMVKKAVDAGSTNWNKDNVAKAVQNASLPELDLPNYQYRKYEELIRENVIDFAYTKASRVIKTRHLFVTELTGKVSHYILWPNGPADEQLLFEHLDAYESINDVVVPIVFDYGDGTIHGSWGAGQLIYDLSVQVEKVRCDSIDNLRNSNKQRLQVPNAKDMNSVKMVVEDTMIIASGAQFAQNVGGITQNAEGYMVLDDRMTRWMQEMVGGYLPPIPMQPSDIKAAQVNAAIQQEQEVQRDVLEGWLKQISWITSAMTKRLLNPESDDKVAKETRAKLLGEQPKDEPPQPILISKQELDILVSQQVLQSITDFTQYAASERGQFAASVKGDPRFNQVKAARLQAEGVASGGQVLADQLVINEGDQTLEAAARRQQLLENTTLLLGQDVPVLVTDPAEIHMKAMEEPLTQAINGGLIQAAEAGLRHFSGHFESGMATRSLSPGTDNEWKAKVARFQKAIEAKKQELAAQAPQGPQVGAAPA